MRLLLIQLWLGGLSETKPQLPRGPRMVTPWLQLVPHGPKSTDHVRNISRLCPGELVPVQIWLFVISSRETV